MNSTLSIANNKNFVLLLEDSKEAYFEEKDLFSFIKYRDEELKIFNKDKRFIFSKFSCELKSTFEKYILNNKNRLEKLNKIIIEEGVVDKIRHNKKEECSDDLREIRKVDNEKSKIIKEVNEGKERLNKFLDVLNEGAINVIRSIIHISHFINCNDKNTDEKFINELGIDVDKLRDRSDNINLNGDFFKLSIEDLKVKLNELNLIISELDKNKKRIAMFKEHKLNIIYEGISSYKLFTINQNDVDFKKYFFDKIRDVSSQLYLYHGSLENPKGLFFRIYKYLFPNKYLEKQKKIHNAFNQLNMLYKNLFCLLQSKDFKNNSVPKWACKLVAKTINESIPMNDIFWQLSKERTEWNKIYKEFILEKEGA